MEKRKLAASILAIIATFVIFLSPLSLLSSVHCYCGGCCKGCPGDCNTLGMPLPWYYWGSNAFEGYVSGLSMQSLFVDIIAWLVVFGVVFLMYKYVYRKEVKKKRTRR